MNTMTKARPVSIQNGTAPALVPADVNNEAASLMAVITRAASDPSIDIDKLERLVVMHEKIVTRNAEQAFNAAMAKAQSEMRRIAVDSANPQTRSRYASYAALDRAVRPIYTTNGFGLSFGTDVGGPPDHVRVVCDVSRGPVTRRFAIDMPADGKGAKGGDVMTKTHATGSAVTYGRRYLLAMIFNLAIGQDDDGNAAGDAGDKITPEQVQALRDKLTATGADEARFLKFGRVSRLEDIAAAKYEMACAAIEKYARERSNRRAAQ